MKLSLLALLKKILIILTHFMKISVLLLKVPSLHFTEGFFITLLAGNAEENQPIYPHLCSIDPNFHS